MTPSTRFVALVLAISWLPCALAAADTGSPDLAALERRLQATFERKIEAEVERILESELRRKVRAEMELLIRELYCLAWLSHPAGTSPAAPAPEGAAAHSMGTSYSAACGSSRAGAAEAPPPPTVCTFSPPSTFVCVLRPGSESPATASP